MTAHITLHTFWRIRAANHWEPVIKHWDWACCPENKVTYFSNQGETKTGLEEMNRVSNTSVRKWANYFICLFIYLATNKALVNPSVCWVCCVGQTQQSSMSSNLKVMNSEMIVFNFKILSFFKCKHQKIFVLFFTSGSSYTNYILEKNNLDFYKFPCFSWGISNSKWKKTKVLI